MLFMGGMVPGIILGTLIGIVAMIITKKKGWGGREGCVILE